MRFKVLVVGDAAKRFDTAEDALQYAERRVYLGPDHRSTALDVLRNGREFSYTYGYSEVQIVPAGAV